MKKYAITIITIFFLCVILIVSFIYTIDPLCMYRCPSDTAGYTIDSGVYNNPGIARSYDYDSMVMGSSMLANTSVSQLDELYGIKTIKTNFLGANPLNYKYMMDVVFREHEEIKYIFCNFDISTFYESPDSVRYNLPMYLYDNNIFNDINYLASSYGLSKSFDVVFTKNKGTRNIDMDEAFAWYNDFKGEFKVENVIRSYKSMHIPAYKDTIDRSNVMKNLEYNIIPFIEQYPKTQFVIILPPYSILFWEKISENELMDIYLEDLQAIIEQLDQYDNVLVCSFQAEKDIICDLALYKDATHYDISINDFMSENLFNEKYIVNSLKFSQWAEYLKELVDEYDYKEFYPEY